MKRIFIGITILFLVMSGCSLKVKETNKAENDAAQNDLNIYYEFLRGEVCLSEDENENVFTNVQDMFNLDDNNNKFTFFDSDHNGIPELHLSSMRDYIVIEDVNNVLVMIYSGSGYETLLNNGAILYTRVGGGPSHISYAYIELEADTITTVRFSKYNTDNEDPNDDLYLFEDTEITQNEFDIKTKDYLSVGSNEILWTDYKTFLSEKN